MFVSFITACYSANLAAFLTTQKFNNMINSAEELLNQNQISFGAENVQLRLLRKSKSDLHKDKKQLYCLNETKSHSGGERGFRTRP